jgi:hypothetical protein
MPDETGAIAAAINASLAHVGTPIWAGEIGPHNVSARSRYGWLSLALNGALRCIHT